MGSMATTWSLVSLLVLWQLRTCASNECAAPAYLHGDNIAQLAGCTILQGNLIISAPSLQGDSPLNLSDLNLLLTLQHVEGYLQIENFDHENFTNLRFLRNVHTISGNTTVEVHLRNYALHIEGNDYLKTLNLASLQTITNGGVRISQNPQLCLVDMVTTVLGGFLANSDDVLRIAGLGTSGECDGVRCHGECDPGMGCWGTLADECISCRHYDYQGTCVSSCNQSLSVANETAGICIPLAPSPPPSTPSSLPLPTHTLPNHTSPTSTFEPLIHIAAMTTVSIPSQNDLEWSPAVSIGVGTGLGLVLMVTTVIVIMIAAGCYHWKMRKRRKPGLTRRENVKLLQVAASPSPSPPAPSPTGEAAMSNWEAAKRETSYSSLGPPQSSLSRSLQRHSSGKAHDSDSNTVSRESHATLGEQSRDNHDSDHVTLFGSPKGNSVFSKRVSHHGHMTSMTSHGSHMTPTSSSSKTSACHTTSSANTLRMSSQRRIGQRGPRHPDYRGGHRTRNFTDPPHSYSYTQSNSQAKRYV